MKKKSVFRAASALAAVSFSAFGADTRTWTQSFQEEFEKGNLKKVAVRSDGRLSLAPVFREVLDASASYLWALARDSRGRVYAGGGGPGGGKVKLFEIDAAGGSRAVAELDGFEIHALAVDRRDRVYAATSPDGKVYRIAAGGKSEVFYEPKTKYIWAMAFNSRGDLFVATGDTGEIHRVTPEGKGSVFFKTEETHARSLAVDSSDNVVAGTEPGGLILRITASGAGASSAEGFVLHQAAKREVTAVAVAADGSVWAAAVGNKQPAAAPVLQPSAPLPPPASPAGAMPGAISPRPVAQPPPTLLSAAPVVSGGSEVYRIDREGFPRRVWSHAQDIVYAIGFDAQGRALVGGGNKGAIYRLESDTLWTLLVNAPPTQITAFSSGSDGKVFAATGNVGKVYQIGPGLETEGTIESDVLDAQIFSNWGQLRWEGQDAGGRVAFETRSGNLDRPQKNWSPWTAVMSRVASPPARFLQWRLTLGGGPAGQSPEVSSIEVAYLPRNVAPVVDLIEITPANHRFSSSSLTLGGSQSLTLPPVGQRKRAAAPGLTESASTSMQYAKGHLGARWQAADLNGDSLVYTVEIRGAGEREWKLLKDKVREKQVSWDTSGFPDGHYRLRVTASDSPSNAPAQALQANLESEPPFVIDNTAPQISGLEARPSGGGLEVRWKAVDVRSVLSRGEYAVNGGDWLPAPPTTRLSDSREHDYLVTLASPPAGEITIAVRVTDAWDNQTAEKVVHRR